MLLYTSYCFGSCSDHVLDRVPGESEEMEGREGEGREGEIFTQHYARVSHLGEAAWRV